MKKIALLWDKGVGEKLLQMDILQTIGFSLLFSAILWLISKSAFIPVLLSLGIFDIFLIFYKINITESFFKYFFSSELSPFPFFPWSLYFIVGVLSSKYLKKKSNLLLIFSIVLCSVQIFVSGTYAERIADIGKILLLFEICKRFCTTVPQKMNAFMRASRESLFLYISHIMIVYGSVLSKGLSFYIGANLSFSGFLIVFITMSALLYFVAFYINLIRERCFSLFLLIKSILYLIFFVEFFKRPW